VRPVSADIAVAGAELQLGAFGLAAPVVVDGTATASVGVISLERLPERRAAQRVLTASAQHRRRASARCVQSVRLTPLDGDGD